MPRKYLSWFVPAMGIAAAVILIPSVARSETPLQIKQRVVDLIAALHSTTSLDAAWASDAAALRGRLLDLEQSDKVAAATARANELEPLLTALSGSSNSLLRTSTTKLIEAASTIEASEPIEAFDRRLGRLYSLVTANGFPASNSKVTSGFAHVVEISVKVDPKSAVEQFKAQSEALVKIVQDEKPDGSNIDVIATIGKLVAAVETVELAQPASAIVRRANSAAKIVADQMKPSLPAAKDANVQKSLTDLSDVITAALGTIQSRVHIVSAQYGDLSIHGRYCDATSSLLSACERKPNCAVATAMIDLCGGYDPAPRASEFAKRLEVKYQCVAGGEGVWARLDTADKSVEPGTRVRTATLRSPTQKLICTAPAS